MIGRKGCGVGRGLFDLLLHSIGMLVPLSEFLRLTTESSLVAIQTLVQLCIIYAVKTYIFPSSVLEKGQP